MIPAPAVIEGPDFDAQLQELPNSDAVFVVWAGDASTYLAKTSMLRRRLLRILRPGEPSRGSLNLRSVATRVEYWLTGSRFESGLVHYSLARQHYRDSYLKLIKLRMPPYVRLILSNAFPRTQVTARLSGGSALQYGPFRSRLAAEQFETQLLDLFQIRRCQEDLAPALNHPGCIYGEMNMCLRPCQQVVSVEEYRGEVNRVAEFLTYNGRLIIQTIGAARDRLSEEMNFEEAARQHKRLDRVTQLLALREDLACDIERLFGVAITASATPDAVKLWFVCRGCWQEAYDFPLTSHVSLDQRLRELMRDLTAAVPSRQERQEHLALLTRWNYSSWRDGEWIQFESPDQAPYRRIVRAISRVHGGAQASLPLQN
jgi:excinuclease UvrABC nuclease subunit